MNGTDYRLTEEDETRIRVALRRAVSEWDASPVSGSYRIDAAARVTLQRIGAHAIGCGLDDLRSVELEWIDNEIGTVGLGL